MATSLLKCTIYEDCLPTFDSLQLLRKPYNAPEESAKKRTGPWCEKNREGINLAPETAHAHHPVPSRQSSFILRFHSIKPDVNMLLNKEL